MKQKFLLAIMTMGMMALYSCQQDGIDIAYYTDAEYSTISKHLNIPEYPLDYNQTFPAYYSTVPLEIDRNKATLGRVLFYDKKLSKDESISCASCHKQNLGFADDVARSKGVNNQETTRNSLALGAVFNFREYYGSAQSGRVPFFWDNSASTVEEQSKKTFANEREMDMDMHEVIGQVENLDYYAPLFKSAYGSDEITEENVLDAISEFINSMSSFSSLYDIELDKYNASNGNLAGMEMANFPGFSSLQNQGKRIYQQNCASCHGSTNGFPGRLAGNNGLYSSYEDAGIGNLPGKNDNDIGTFKVPTLRNIAVTGPYMHDGSIATLEEVVEHYSTGIQNHENLSPELREGGSYGDPIQFNYTQEEKQALIAFLNTFTDEFSLTDERYTDPFK